MSRLENMKINRLLASLAVVSILVVMGCSVDSPTAPDQVATDPPTSGANSWKITVNVNPDQIPVSSDVPATVNVKVESRADGSNPPNGTTMTLSTSLGEFSALGSELTSVGVSIHGGKASALLFGGEVAAGGTVVARLGGSEDRDDFRVVGAVEAFISSIVPNSGSESGGTRITINGVGFVEPLRVAFQAADTQGEGEDVEIVTLIDYGTVTSVSPTSIEVITPSAPGSLISGSCGVGGVEYFNTPVDVSVELAAGSTAVLDDGFTYTPDNKGCNGG